MTALVRFAGADGAEAGTLDGDEVTPVGLPDEPWPATVARWHAAPHDVPAAGSPVPAASVRLLPPVGAGSRVFCVAQNYPAHAAEAGGASPPRPVVFLKPVEAFVGHGATATLPASSSFFDYEGEIAVVIGEHGTALEPARAADAIAGYTVANDGSARDLQPATLADRFQVDWFAAKCSDRASALGPGVVPAAEVAPPESLWLRTWHNDELVQDDVAASMYHSIPDVVSFVSRIVELRPGDVVLTGTPAGVGKARGVRLAPGDVVTVAAAGLGRLTTHYAH